MFGPPPAAGADAAAATLWPTAGVRARWLHALHEARTVAEVALLARLEMLSSPVGPHTQAHQPPLSGCSGALLARLEMQPPPLCRLTSRHATPPPPSPRSPWRWQRFSSLRGRLGSWTRTRTRRSRRCAAGPPGRPVVVSCPGAPTLSPWRAQVRGWPVWMPRASAQCHSHPGAPTASLRCAFGPPGSAIERSGPLTSRRAYCLLPTAGRGGQEGPRGRAVGPPRPRQQQQQQWRRRQQQQWRRRAVAVPQEGQSALGAQALLVLLFGGVRRAVRGPRAGAALQPPI